jgi:ATP-binding cassette subfamily F protein 3
LIEALNKYEGTIILVSHDRYFISKTANKIWEIVDHEIKEFKGGYEEWVAWKERMEKAKTEKKTAAKAATPPVQDVKQVVKTANNPANNKPQQSAPINKEAKKELQKWQREFQQLEEQLAKLNIRKNELEASLSDPATYSDKNKFLVAENAYKKAEDELNQLNTRYETVFEKIMTLEGKN